MTEEEHSYCDGGCVAMHHNDAPVFLPPRERKAKISIWRDINVTDMDTLDCLDSPTLIRCHLVTVFRLDDHEINPCSAALLDMFYHGVQFARDNCFSRPQTAAFLSILRQVHDCCVETPFDNIESCHSFLRQLVLCHSVLRPPFSLDLFSLDAAQSIVEYVTDTYFRHYKLYKYVFTPDVSLDLALTYPNIPPPQESDAIAAEESKQEPEQAMGEHNAAKDGTAAVAAGDHIQESEECTTLRRLVRLHLTEELNRLKICADMEMKAAMEAVEAKVESVEKVSEVDLGNERSSGKKNKKDKDLKQKK